jgi:hypothetical protein
VRAGSTPPELPELPELPEQAYAASLAGFDLMTVHRLSALLRRHTPAEAFAVAAGEASPGPDGLVARVLDLKGRIAGENGGPEKPDDEADALAVAARQGSGLSLIKVANALEAEGYPGLFHSVKSHRYVCRR